MPSFKILVYESGARVRSLTIGERVEIGRVDPRLNEPQPVATWLGPDMLRLVIAEPHRVAIPRHWFQVFSEAEGEIEVTNIHTSSALKLSHDASIEPGESRRFEQAIEIELSSELSMRIEPTADGESDDNAYRTLDSIPPAPGQDALFAETKTIREFSAPDAVEITKMLRVALQVVQKAAGSDAFFQAAVAATTEIVDLDWTVLLLRRDVQEVEQIAMTCPLPDGWCTVAEHFKNDRASTMDDPTVSTSLLKRVMNSCQTVIHDSLERAFGPAHEMLPESLQPIDCAVASPILNHRREVIGVLYGYRNFRVSESPNERIGDMEAALVEILAGSVAGGIARRAEEKLRHTLSGFFSSKVANQLANNPALMDGQDAEVSVLFCDVRGFSSVTEKVGPKKAIEWINDVMSELSGCVLDRDGVLVDYVGDELLAMWGAPGSQLDHAALAVDAARAMLDKIEILRTRWADTLPGRFGAGIGINSGPARVGNVGSKQKFKYGPLGNTVNLGSRLQSATKQLGVNCIASQETVRAAGQIAESRRICKLGVVGIDQPVSVYEISTPAADNWQSLAQQYQEALALFEDQRFNEAARAIGVIMAEHPGDLPSRKLLSRVLIEMDEPTANFTGEWKLTSK